MTPVEPADKSFRHSPASSQVRAEAAARTQEIPADEEAPILLGLPRQAALQPPQDERGTLVDHFA